MKTLLSTQTPKPAPASAWNYEEAFCRNLGILTEDEQNILRGKRIAIIGMGGVGGIHLMTLARLGIGRFTIADPDTFELANFNRQYGANIDSLGRPKAEVMAENALAVNPELDIRVMSEPVSAANVAEFLKDADLLVDGVDFFAIEARRLAFAEARRKGLWAVTCGPHAFSAAWLLFDPNGMTFDRYFDIHDSMSEPDKLVAFAVGCVPAALHLKYLNMAVYFRPGAKAGASLGLACHVASGIVGTEAVRILLKRPGLRPAPYYFQYDLYRQKLRKGWLWGGNRHPLQRIKRRWLRGKMKS